MAEMATKTKGMKQTATQFLTGKPEHSHIAASGSLYSFAMVEQYLEEFAGQHGRTLIEVEHERYEWAKITFPEATAFSSLLKAEDEIREIKADIAAGKKEPQEYADAIMCIFDSAARQGITPEMIEEAYAQKVTINKLRRWVKNPDNTYSHVPYANLTPEEQTAIDRATPWRSTPGGSYTPELMSELAERNGCECRTAYFTGEDVDTFDRAGGKFLHYLPGGMVEIDFNGRWCKYPEDKIVTPAQYNVLCQLPQCKNKPNYNPEDGQHNESAAEAKNRQNDVEK